MYFCEAFAQTVDLDPEAWDWVSETFLNFDINIRELNFMHDGFVKDVEKLISESRKCFSALRDKRKLMDDCSERYQAETDKQRMIAASRIL